METDNITPATGIFSNSGGKGDWWCVWGSEAVGVVHGSGVTWGSGLGVPLGSGFGEWLGEVARCGNGKGCKFLPPPCNLPKGRGHCVLHSAEVRIGGTLLFGP